jgi:hypothetical protein
MARKTQVVLLDDVDGGIADETVTFALDGVEYEIDLSTSNAARLREALAPWVGGGRRIGGRARSARRGSVRSSGGRNTEIREWARANGYTVSDRGRIPAEVKAAFDAR